MKNFEVDDIDKQQLKHNLQQWKDELIGNVSKEMEELMHFNFFNNQYFDDEYNFDANCCMEYKYDDSGCKATPDKKNICIHWSFINDKYVKELCKIVDSFVFKRVQDIVKNQVDKSSNQIIGCSDKFSFNLSEQNIAKQEWVIKALPKETQTDPQQGQEGFFQTLGLKFKTLGLNVSMFLLVKALSFMGKKNKLNHNNKIIIMIQCRLVFDDVSRILNEDDGSYINQLSKQLNEYINKEMRK